MMISYGYFIKIRKMDMKCKSAVASFLWKFLSFFNLK